MVIILSVFKALITGFKEEFLLKSIQKHDQIAEFFLSKLKFLRCFLLIHLIIHSIAFNDRLRTKSLGQTVLKNLNSFQILLLNFRIAVLFDLFWGQSSALSSLKDLVDANALDLKSDQSTVLASLGLSGQARHRDIDSLNCTRLGWDGGLDDNLGLINVVVIELSTFDFEAGEFLGEDLLVFDGIFFLERVEESGFDNDVFLDHVGDIDDGIESLHETE
mmetsp:Transcript_10126/g.8645  ORF Transcript_10126/g.8645 Transcript_10126/m.8645 type:complete len:219 (-) Transcript_10126:112-768(-)